MMKKIIFICVLCFSTLSFADLGSTIFSFDGKDFTRTDTTLIDENGEVAVNTKLDHNNPGYKALLKKKSWSGKVTLFGKEYDSNYAPLTDKNGKLIGALNVFKDAD
jgi:methyl-accepting chemotaxis protein-2 (aspartate sensor receptor)